MNWLRKEESPWWQAGLLLGLLNIATFFTADYRILDLPGTRTALNRSTLASRLDLDGEKNSTSSSKS
jgi:hypothetical protein